eukprot:GHVN01030082.1.p3 GENE.GHVN01030082.1~~GHVN01030082.1.p3  ORF type:complete len:150 (+),score=37.90 GHVN01030082.1:1761-2210(+)
MSASPSPTSPPHPSPSITTSPRFATSSLTSSAVPPSSAPSSSNVASVSHFPTAYRPPQSVASSHSTHYRYLPTNTGPKGALGIISQYHQTGGPPGGSSSVTGPVSEVSEVGLLFLLHELVGFVGDSVACRRLAVFQGGGGMMGGNGERG